MVDLERKSSYLDSVWDSHLLISGSSLGKQGRGKVGVEHIEDLTVGIDIFVLLFCLILEWNLHLMSIDCIWLLKRVVGSAVALSLVRSSARLWDSCPVI